MHVTSAAHHELSIVETRSQYAWVYTTALHQQKEEVYMRLGLSGPEGTNNLHKQVAQMPKVPTLAIASFHLIW